MFSPKSVLTPLGGFGRILVSAGLGACGFLGAQEARAHFVLLSPPSWVEEDSLGNPQKAEPCGGEGGEPSGVVSTYRAGSTITVRWQETVAHPGHFRIALATDREDLVDPPVMTTSGDGVTGVSMSAEIQDPPTYPVLQDGLFPRGLVLAPEPEPFSVEVQLPEDITCERCTLQVLQFMANHVPGFFYHHCADLRIVPPGADISEVGVPTVPEMTDGDAEAMSSGSDESGGCSLKIGGQRSSWPGGALLLLGLGLGLWRRRRTQPLAQNA